MAREWSPLVLHALAASDGTGPCERTYVIGGGHEARNNLSSQQDRALNLLAAVAATRDLAAMDIAVVGAGVAGATFAAGAARYGVKSVTLFDEHEEPLVPQRWTLDRYLHPNLYDWPAEGWDLPDAAKWVLDWTADRAAHVRADLVGGFAAFASAGSIRFCSQTVVTGFRERGGKVEVDVQDLRSLCTTQIHHGAILPPPPARRFVADLLVLATGFLPEPRVDSDRHDHVSGSYWRSSGFPPLVQNLLPNVVPVIVGDGDGALTDALDTVLAGGWPGVIQGNLTSILTGLAGTSLAREALEIDSAAMPRLRTGTLEALAEAAGAGMAALDAALATMTSGATVEVRARPPLLGRNSFLLNRLLAARLSRGLNPAIVFTEHPDVKVSDLKALPDVPAVWRTGPRRRERSAVGAPALDFRHPSRLLATSSATAAIAGAVDEMLDWTREPRWTTVLPALSALPALPPAPVPAVPLAASELAGRAALAGATTRPVNWLARVEIAEPPKHFRRDVEELAVLWAGADALGLGAWWGSGCSQPGCDAVCVGLDVVAAHTDLTPGEVAQASTLCDAPFALTRTQQTFGGVVHDRACLHVPLPTDPPEPSDPRLLELVSLLFALET